MKTLSVAIASILMFDVLFIVSIVATGNARFRRLRGESDNLCQNRH